MKVAVIERHKNTRHIGIGYLQGYGLKSGAVATSISHDSHNIIVVGTSEEEMALAANRVVENRGGIVVTEGGAVTRRAGPCHCRHHERRHPGKRKPGIWSGPRPWPFPRG